MKINLVVLLCQVARTGSNLAILGHKLDTANLHFDWGLLYYAHTSAGIAGIQMLAEDAHNIMQWITNMRRSLPFI